MKLCECGKEIAADQGECYRCRVASVGWALKGGALVGSDAWNMTKTDYLREHMGVDSEKQLLKTRPDIAKAD